MNKIDVIVVLGGGITADGILSSATLGRLGGLIQKSVILPSIPIILSGRWSGFVEVKPQATEAEEMKKYLIERGVNENQIIVEAESLDTISNAVFVRKIIEGHHDWKRILLATSDWHMERALWIFQKILGENYQVMPLSINSEETEKKQRRDYEEYLLGVAKRFLKDISASSKELIDLLKDEHPFYSKGEKAQKLLKEMVSHKKQISA